MLIDHDPGILRVEKSAGKQTSHDDGLQTFPKYISMHSMRTLIVCLENTALSVH